MTAVGSPQQAAEKIAADLSVLADKLDTLRERPDWHHDHLIAPALRALTSASRSTAEQRAKRRAARDEHRADDLARAHVARSPMRTSAGDRRTGGPAGVVRKAKASKRP
ncbi:hypothetical protein [Mycolicibacterium hippocampi]|uniref:Uncharacterized protein n=1 Tax=Mycolicibacterium hippocampi TaxID=659824 RepID=A0A850PTS6_9MYCO|nr:hypothetical protein [Mycolicibacterium hippocampi]NVN52267.1 hypothetical protein [Mycolicibacterium hippocampi]